MQRVLAKDPCLARLLIDQDAVQGQYQPDLRAMHTTWSTGAPSAQLDIIKTYRKETLRVQVKMSAELVAQSYLRAGEMERALLDTMVAEFLASLLYNIVKDNVELPVPEALPERPDQHGYYIAGWEGYAVLAKSYHQNRLDNIFRLAKMPRDLVLWLPEPPYNAMHVLRSMTFYTVVALSDDRTLVVSASETPVRTYIRGSKLYRAT